MSLKNESKQAMEDTRSLYREYTEGMTRERISRELQSDTKRLKELFNEAAGSDTDDKTGEPVPFVARAGRFIKVVTGRMNPTRRLVFGLSFIGFTYSTIFSGLLPDLLMPASFLAMAAILMLELLEKLDVKKEIDLAKEIQISLLPSPEIRVQNLDIHSFANTAHDVGGDYIDIITTPKGVYYIIADVSGKGLSAALYMVRMQALVHLIIKKQDPSPKQLFLELNDYIKSYRNDKTFITACAAFFPKGENHFLFARAGHNPPLHFKRAKDSTYLMQSTGFALGMTRTDRLEKFMKEVTVPYETGDSFLFYTDGLTEARNESGEEFGMERARSLLDIYGSLEPHVIVKKVQSSIENFIGDMPTTDDVTYSCIRMMPHPPEKSKEAEIVEEASR